MRHFGSKLLALGNWLHCMGRFSGRFIYCLALVLLPLLQDYWSMSFSGPVAKARSGAGAKDYVLVMHEMCPFAQRAWFALEESGLSFRLKQVGLSSSLVYDLNPKGLVPVLVDPDGKVIVESEDIVDVIAQSASKTSKAPEAASLVSLCPYIYIEEFHASHTHNATEKVLLLEHCCVIISLHPQ